MSKTIINSEQVKEVRQDGIVYLDNENKEQFIDFEQCYQNYLTRHLSPEGIKRFKELNHKTDDDVEDHIHRVKEWREIANRNVLGDNFMDQNSPTSLPYFEFHTAPPTRIEFESKDELWEMRNKIEREFRWRTFDLT